MRTSLHCSFFTFIFIGHMENLKMERLSTILMKLRLCEWAQNTENCYDIHFPLMTISLCVHCSHIYICECIVIKHKGSTLRLDYAVIWPGGIVNANWMPWENVNIFLWVSAFDWWREREKANQCLSVMITRQMSGSYRSSGKKENHRTIGFSLY